MALALQPTAVRPATVRGLRAARARRPPRPPVRLAMAARGCGHHHRDRFDAAAISRCRRRAAVGRPQLHPRRRLHHAAARLPVGEVAAEAAQPTPRRLPARPRLQGALQRHRGGEGGDSGSGGRGRGDGGGDGEPARRHHARRRPPRQELPLQVGEPVRANEEGWVQGSWHQAARHGTGRFLQRRAHPNRDHQFTRTTA